MKDKIINASKKTTEFLKTGSLIALVYFLYSIFDSRYVLKAEYNQVNIDMAQIKTTMVYVKDKSDSNEDKLVAILEVLE